MHHYTLDGMTAGGSTLYAEDDVIALARTDLPDTARFLELIAEARKAHAYARRAFQPERMSGFCAGG